MTNRLSLRLPDSKKAPCFFGLILATSAPKEKLPPATSSSRVGTFLPESETVPSERGSRHGGNSWDTVLLYAHATYTQMLVKAPSTVDEGGEKEALLVSGS